MLEALPRIHWTEFQSCFSTKNTNRIETLKKLEDSLEQLYHTWKSQCRQHLLKQGVSVCIIVTLSYQFFHVLFYSLLRNIYKICCTQKFPLCE